MPHHNKHARKLEAQTPTEQVNPEQERNLERGGTQDTADPRAKNTRHRKQTADKWNQ
jgi:hypothetical protein